MKHIILIMGQFFLAANIFATDLTLSESSLFAETDNVEHGSSVLPLSNGEILLCWYAGSAEAHKDVHIYCRKKVNETWGQRFVVVRPKERPSNSILPNAKLGNTVLVQGQDGIVYIFYSAIPISGGFSNSRVDFKFSRDMGLTWSKSKRLDFNIGSMVKNKMFYMGGDQYMLPLYDELSLATPGFKLYSYTLRLQLRDGEVKRLHRSQIPGADHIQPAVTLCGPNGRLCAYMRNKNRGLTYFSEYNWGTERWSKRTTVDVPNSNSPADVVNLSDGRVLMVYNNRPDRPRSPLSLAVSSDGVNFKHVVDLESDLAHDFHYPCLQKDGAGNFHLSYTFHDREGIKYVRFTETELMKLIDQSEAIESQSLDQEISK